MPSERATAAAAVPGCGACQSIGLQVVWQNFLQGCTRRVGEVTPHRPSVAGPSVRHPQAVEGVLPTDEGWRKMRQLSGYTTSDRPITTPAWAPRPAFPSDLSYLA